MRWRWWVALPLAVVVVLLASASRVQIFWWPSQLHEETAGRQGRPVSVVDRWTDEHDREHERHFDVTLVDVRPAATFEGYDGPEPINPPSGVAVWRIALDFDVDPDVPMGGCRVTLVDTKGRETDVVGGVVGDAYLPPTLCEPENRRGPEYDGTVDPDYLPRVRTYRIAAFAVTASDVVPASVRLSWEPPDYTELDVTE